MRDFNDEQYKKWRKQVYVRDGYTCKMCGAKKKLEAHHIKLWAHFPELRFDVNNGITLCKKCHKEITGNEEAYEARFKNLINPKVTDVYISLLKELYNDDNS